MTPKPTNTEDSAVAANAPSTTGDHSTKHHLLSLRATGVVSFRAAGGILSIDISMALAKAEEGKNRQNYDDETDEIDKSVHELAPLYTRPHSSPTIYWYRQSSPVRERTCNAWALDRRRMGRHIDAAAAEL